MDSVILSLYITFGAIILAGYVYMIYKSVKDPEGFGQEIWTNSGRNMFKDGYGYVYYLYILMCILSLISGGYLVYYLTTSDLNKTLVYTGSVFFLVFSLFWAFKPFWTISRWSLGLVALGVLLILVSMSMSYKQEDVMNSLGIAAGTILLIQTFFFDFVLWNGFLHF